MVLNWFTFCVRVVSVSQNGHLGASIINFFT
jgi:hypothetical protein